MSRYRPIDPRIWSDEKFKLLSKPKPNAQTLWLFLLTGPHTNGCPGLFHRGEMALAEEIGWSLSDFRRCFKEIEALGLAFADWNARVVLIPNAIKYDAPKSINTIKKWGYDFEEIPNCELKWKFYQLLEDYLRNYHEGFIDTFYKSFKYLAKHKGNGSDTCFDENKITNQERSQEGCQKDINDVSQNSYQGVKQDVSQRLYQKPYQRAYQKPSQKSYQKPSQSLLQYTNTNTNTNTNTLTTDISKGKTKEKAKVELKEEVDLKSFQLAEILLREIRKRKPDFMPGKNESLIREWSVHISRMIRIDKRVPERIEEVIRWCQQDDFWKNNILSTKKLREQFDQLELKMEQKSRKISPYLEGLKPWAEKILAEEECEEARREEVPAINFKAGNSI